LNLKSFHVKNFVETFKIKKLMKSLFYRNLSLVYNFSFLSVTQIFNICIPLIIYPYLIRVVGLDKYGLVIYAQTIIAYLVIVVSFGFNITAVREISIFREDKDKINQIFSSVISIKFFLFIFSLFILGLFITFLPLAKAYKFLFLISMWACLLEIIFPVWYFQGIEKMKYITYITLANRLLFLVLVFLIIKSPNDYLFIPLLNGGCAIISGCISLYVILVRHKIKFNFQPIKVLKKYFKEAVNVFLSEISIVLYINTNKVIIGSYLGLSSLSYYDLAEKVISILKIPQSMLTQTIFPKICLDKNITLVKKKLIFSLCFHVFLVTFFYLFSKEIVILIGGEQMIGSIKVVKILLLSVPIVVMSNILGVLILLPLGYKKEYTKVIVTSGLIYILLILITKTVLGFSITSIAGVILLTEIFVLIYMFYYVNKYSLWRKNMTI